MECMFPALTNTLVSGRYTYRLCCGHTKANRCCPLCKTPPCITYKLDKVQSRWLLAANYVPAAWTAMPSAPGDES
jgi:hypothetical protein